MSHKYLKAISSFAIAYGVGEVLDFIFYKWMLVSPSVGHVLENLATAAMVVGTLLALGFYNDPVLTVCPLDNPNDCPFIVEKKCRECGINKGEDDSCTRS